FFESVARVSGRFHGPTCFIGCVSRELYLLHLAESKADKMSARRRGRESDVPIDSFRPLDAGGNIAARWAYQPYRNGFTGGKIGGDGSRIVPFVAKAGKAVPPNGATKVGGGAATPGGGR